MVADDPAHPFRRQPFGMDVRVDRQPVDPGMRPFGLHLEVQAGTQEAALVEPGRPRAGLQCERVLALQAHLVQHLLDEPDGRLEIVRGEPGLLSCAPAVGLVLLAALRGRWAAGPLIDGIVAAGDVVTALRGPGQEAERSAEPVTSR